MEIKLIQYVVILHILHNLYFGKLIIIKRHQQDVILLLQDISQQKKNDFKR